MPPKTIISPRRADGDVQELEQDWKPNPGYDPTPKQITCPLSVVVRSKWSATAFATLQPRPAKNLTAPLHDAAGANDAGGR